MQVNDRVMVCFTDGHLNGVFFSPVLPQLACFSLRGFNIKRAVVSFLRQVPPRRCSEKSVPWLARWLWRRAFQSITTARYELSWKRTLRDTLNCYRSVCAVQHTSPTLTPGTFHGWWTTNKLSQTVMCLILKDHQGIPWWWNGASWHRSAAWRWKCKRNYFVLNINWSFRCPSLLWNNRIPNVFYFIFYHLPLGTWLLAAEKCNPVRMQSCNLCLWACLIWHMHLWYFSLLSVLIFSLIVCKYIDWICEFVIVPLALL